MNIHAKTAALAAVFLVAGVAGSSAQFMEPPEVDVPTVGPGVPTDVQPPGALIDERRAGSPRAFGSGGAAGGGVIEAEPNVGPVPAVPPPDEGFVEDED